MGRFLDFLTGADLERSNHREPDFSYYEPVQETRSEADLGIDTDGTPYFLPEIYSPTTDYIPTARGSEVITLDTAISIPAVYRAIDILSTAVSQLRLKVVRNGLEIETPTLIKQPNPFQSLSQFLKRTVIGLAGNGNAFWLLHRYPEGDIYSIEILDPLQVQIQYNQKTGAKQYLYGKTTYNAAQVVHLRNGEFPGHDRGMGPIQACKTQLNSTLDLKKYATNWYGSGVPSGVLKSDQELNSEQALAAKTQWNEMQAARGVAVLGRGLDYSAVSLSPAEAEFIENQKYSTTTIAMMFGIPAGLMLAEVNGNSMTYTNQEQSTLEFIRFGLMKYLKEIEDALSNLLVRGQTVEFVLEGLLRPDSKTRAEVQKMYLDMGVLTINEIRLAEGLAPLTPAELEAAKPAPPAVAAAPEPAAEVEA